jgi:hypothetical protein
VLIPLLASQGHFPRSWRQVFTNRLELNLDGNTGLDGCVPLNSYTALSHLGTQITGLCDLNATAVEAQQRQALKNYLPKLLLGVGAAGPGVNQMIQDMVKQTSWLGRLVEDGETTKALVAKHPDTTVVRTLSVSVQVTGGVEYVTSVSMRGPLQAPGCRGPALGDAHGNMLANITYLPLLARKLPSLQEFGCDSCGGIGVVESDMQLLRAMPLAAPKLRILALPGCGLAGSLPAAWGAWRSLQRLELQRNNIQGALPPSYASLANLDRLWLYDNRLQGTLPAAWGDKEQMPTSTWMDFKCNKGLTGTIPKSWAHFSAGQVLLYDTGIDGWAPEGLQVRHDLNMTQCSSVSPEAAALQELKTLLENVSASSSAPLLTWVNGEHHAQVLHWPAHHMECNRTRVSTARETATSSQVVASITGWPSIC